MASVTTTVLVTALAFVAFGCHSSQASDRVDQQDEACPPKAGDDNAKTCEAAGIVDVVQRLLKSVAKEDISFVDDATSRGGVAFKRGQPLDGPRDLGAVVVVPEHESIQTLIRIGLPALPALLEHLSCFAEIAAQPDFPEHPPWAYAYLRLEAWYVNNDRAEQLDRINRFRAAFKTNPATDFKFTIADVCYYVIGQIVNRPYFSLHFAAKTGVAVDTPQRSPELIRELRASWGSLDTTTHFAQLSDEVAPDRDISIRANAYARLLVFYPKRAGGVVAGALADDKDLVALRRFVDSLNLDQDASISNGIVERLKLIGSGPYDEDAILLGLACTDQLIRRQVGSQAARAFLESALARHPESAAIAERLAALSP